MILKFMRICLIIFSFVFLTGFLPFTALLGPGLTVVSSGNIYKASAQFLIDHQIKKKTGKNSLTYVKEEVEKQSFKKELNEELKKLVEKRIKETHKLLIIQNDQKKLNNLIKRRIELAHKKINFDKFNQ
ncbi:hypothetical protein OA107_01915 [Candidatus Pelagibacter sp.]|nr:hypothetical protein [Candidatus Pelagibacter sp.]